MRQVVRSALLACVAVACSTRATPRVVTAPGAGRAAVPDASAAIRVGLITPSPAISATAEFAWHDGSDLVARARRGESWRLERQRGRDRVRAIRPDGGATPWSASLLGSVTANGFMTVNGARYRGRILVIPSGDTLAVINQVPLEDYLRSVVAVEMGARTARDSSALQAQAVAARSYAMVRMGNQERGFDVYSSVLDQAYRGMDVENSAATAAVERTRGIVLWYDGRIADAVYSSTCGGSTAEASEVWGNRSAPYLRRVSDRIGDSDRYYCDIAPRFRWTRDMTAAELNATLSQYLARYADGAPLRDGPGRARQLTITDTTPSGRVGTLMVGTERGTYAIRGNAVRFVIRSPGGEILNSTYFSVESEQGPDGFIDRVTFRGRGYGHGIGMCQWGAIGRARAGQSFRTILATYYPGTSIGLVQ